MTQRLAAFEASVLAKREDEERRGHSPGRGRGRGGHGSGGRGGRGHGGSRQADETAFQLDADLALAAHRASLGAAGGNNGSGATPVDDDAAVDAALDAQLSALGAAGVLAPSSNDSYADRYYRAKFGDEFVADPEARRALARSFIEGTLWVYAYYYQGVASWKWFFPYHYAPLNCDLVDLASMQPFDFDLGQPYSPLEQLLGVLPAASSKVCVL
jgi:hypothetical protein